MSSAHLHKVTLVCRKSMESVDKIHGIHGQCTAGVLELQQWTMSSKSMEMSMEFFQCVHGFFQCVHMINKNNMHKFSYCSKMLTFKAASVTVLFLHPSFYHYLSRNVEFHSPHHMFST